MPGLGDDAHEELIDDVAEQLRGIDAPSVLVGGEQLLDDEMAELAEKDAQRAEMISLPIALVVMAIVFGGVLAAGLPLAVALSGAGVTLLALAGLASFTDVSLYAVNVTLMLGIGLGIDYGLLVISRFREERGAGHDVPAALQRTMATAGRTVVFSAATVAVALVGLAVFPDPTIRSLAYAGIGVVLTTMAAAVTLLPALLAWFGHRLSPAEPASSHGPFARLAHLVMRRAVPVVVVVGVGLVLLAAPFLHARFDDIGVHALPESSETRQVAEAIDARFPAVTAEPVEVLAEVDRDDPRLAGWVDDVSRIPGVVGATIDDEVSGAAVTVVEVHAEGETQRPHRPGGRARRPGARPRFPVLGRWRPGRDRRPPRLDHVPPADRDRDRGRGDVRAAVPDDRLGRRPREGDRDERAVARRHVRGPGLVFQDGHLSGPLGFDPPGSLDLIMPVIVFVFAFGLSMDYEVFLLSRIREVWEETGDNDLAVAQGLQRSGRIITSAALLIVIVFAGFAAGEIVAMKQLGLGLAVAVIVDATVVRCLLVPATMKLMGRWNWWAPAPLARLSARIGLTEAPAAAPAPDQRGRVRTA